MSPEQAEAAKLFLDYLLQPAQQALAMKSYMRPLDTSVPLGEPLDLAHGTDPRVKPGTVKSLPIPSADLMRAVTDVFLITKRKATVLVVMDLSGSMEGDKIRTGTSATANFLKRLQPNDVVGVMTFSDKVQMLSRAEAGVGRGRGPVATGHEPHRRGWDGPLPERLRRDEEDGRAEERG